MWLTSSLKSFDANEKWNHLIRSFNLFTSLKNSLIPVWFLEEVEWNKKVMRTMVGNNFLCSQCINRSIFQKNKITKPLLKLVVVHLCTETRWNDITFFCLLVSPHTGTLATLATQTKTHTQRKNTDISKAANIIDKLTPQRCQPEIFFIDSADCFSR